MFSTTEPILDTYLKFIDRALGCLKNFDGELKNDVDAGELEEEHQDQGDGERHDHRSAPKLPDPDLKRTGRNRLICCPIDI